MKHDNEGGWRKGVAAVATVGVLAAGPLVAAGTAAAEPGVPPVGPRPTTVYPNGYPGMTGNSGFAVECVQRALLQNPDGDYGQATFDAIRRFQQAHGLEVDGVVGPLTGDKLVLSLPADRADDCFAVIPTTRSRSAAEQQPIAPRSTVVEDEFLACMDERGTGIDGLLRITKIRKLYKLLKKGKKVDGLDIAKAVPGVDIAVMMTCLRYGHF